VEMLRQTGIEGSEVVDNNFFDVDPFSFFILLAILLTLFIGCCIWRLSRRDRSLPLHGSTVGNRGPKMLRV
jgi:hypothetical protein